MVLAQRGLGRLESHWLDFNCCSIGKKHGLCEQAGCVVGDMGPYVHVTRSRLKSHTRKRIHSQEAHLKGPESPDQHDGLSSVLQQGVDDQEQRVAVREGAQVL